MKRGTSPSPACPNCAKLELELQQWREEAAAERGELDAQNHSLAEAESAVEVSRGRFNELYDRAPVGYLTIDGAGIIHEANATAFAMLGEGANHVLQRPLLPFVHKDQRSAFQQHLLRLRRGEPEVVTELALGGRGGAALTVQLRSAPDESRARERGGRYRTILLDTTLLKATEAALRESEARTRETALRLQTVLNTAPAIIWIGHGRDCHSIDGNRAAHEFSRVPVSVDMSKTGAHPERLAHYRLCKDGVELAPHEMPMQRVAASGEPLSDCALDFVFDDGAARSVLGNVTPLFDGDGQPNGAVGAFMDVTERKRAEEELRETRDYLDKLLSYANTPIIVWDPALKITRFNRAFEHLTGYRAEDVIGQPVDILFAEEHHEEAYGLTRRAAAGERWEAVEIPIRRVDSAICTVLWNSATLYTADGKTVVATIAQGQDITHRKHAEEERERLMELLAAERARWEAVVASMLDPLTICDAEGRATYMNPAYEQMVKRQIGEGVSVDDHPEHYALYHADGTLFDAADLPLQRAALTGSDVHRVEILQRTQHGNMRVAIWNAAPLRGPDGTISGAVAVGRDVTEQRSAEQERGRLERALVEANENLERLVAERTSELRKANAELRAEIEERKRVEADRERIGDIARSRERMAVLGELAAGVAHELRNPLQGVMSYIELIKLKATEQSGLLPMLQQVEHGLHNMDRVASQLLDLSRQNPEPSGASMVASVVEKTWDLMLPQATKHGISLQQHLDANLPPVQVNPVRLMEVFLNLFGNSLDACSGGGVIVVEGRSRPGADGMVEVLVTDNGPGIPKDIRDKVFEPFFTTKPSGKGTGLGLAMVKRIVEGAGGEVGIVDRQASGAAISMTLPTITLSGPKVSKNGFVIA